MQISHKIVFWKEDSVKIFQLNLCIGKGAYILQYTPMQKSEHNLLELVLSFHPMGPALELRLSGWEANSFTWGTTSPTYLHLFKEDNIMKLAYIHTCGNCYHHSQGWYLFHQSPNNTFLTFLQFSPIPCSLTTILGTQWSALSLWSTLQIVF